MRLICIIQPANKMKIYIIAGLAAVVFAAGCAGPMNNTERGAAQGAVAGGILGAIIGNNTKGKNTAEGAAIGALGGAVLGGAIGNSQDKKTGDK